MPHESPQFCGCCADILAVSSAVSRAWVPRYMANHLSFDVLTRLAEQRAAALEAAKARRHLDSCWRCRSELEWLERIRRVPATVADESPTRFR